VNIGNEIAARHTALAPAEAALIIYKALFERGGGTRLSDANKFVALTTITAGLIEWEKNIKLSVEGDAAVWEKRYKDAKAQLDDVMLKYAILKKES
jgi:predicted chitinase